MSPAIECMNHPGNTDPNCRTCWAADLVERATQRDDLLLRVETLERRLARVLMAGQSNRWPTGMRRRGTVWSRNHGPRRASRGGKP